jgi:hypothetical protein
MQVPAVLLLWCCGPGLAQYWIVLAFSVDYREGLQHVMGEFSSCILTEKAVRYGQPLGWTPL